MSIKKLLLSVTVILSGLVMYAQDIIVTGKVTDSSNGEPVPFASIQIQGTMTGASTDGEGNYSISAPETAVLVFSSIGYVTTEVQVAGSAQHDVALSPDTQMLDETIVVAFGTATRESFTGSASVVKSSDIAKVQNSNVTRSLEGVVAGVQMTTSSGSLGSSPSIMIRGISSINAGSEPLYIVDGVPYSGDLNNINPNDIESMTVLKDAASNALYGARGANGVIMITTKKAKAGDAVVNIDAKWGWNSKALKDYDYISDPGQYYEAYYNAYYNYETDLGSSASMAHLNANAALDDLGYMVYTVPRGQTLINEGGHINPDATLGNLVTLPSGEQRWLQPDSWVDEAYRNSLRQEYNVSISGSTERSSYYASFGYLNNKGIVDGSDMYRYTVRLKADYQAKSWLKTGLNMSYANYNWDSGVNEEGVVNSTSNIFAVATRIAPIYPLYVRDANHNIMKDQHGWSMYDYGTGENGAVRPSFYNSNALQQSQLDVQNNEGNAFNGTGFVEVKFLKDFTFTFNAGAGVDGVRLTQVQNPYYGQFASSGGVLAKNHNRNFYFNLQQLLSWDRTFAGKHHATVLLGHESYKTTDSYLGASKTQMVAGNMYELNEAIIDSQTSSSSQSMYNNEGYFARAQYDYANKIFLSASYRRDASSRFHPDHRWGNFWSAGAGWLINEESWFKAPWVDMLKLKASIGSQGNDNIPNYLYIDTWNLYNNEDRPGVSFRQKGNEDITWETNTNFNAGVDFGLFGGRLSGSAEYFYRKTTDMLYFFTLPPSIGYGGYYDNIGDMRNSGIEVALNGNIMRSKNFSWDAYLNFTHYTNKVLSIPDKNKTSVVEGHAGYASGERFIGEGLPLNTFYMAKSAGVDPATGAERWWMEEVNEYGEKTGRTVPTDDYSKATFYLCDDPTPDLYGGFGTSLQFYGFDVSVSFTYSIGGLSYDSGYASYMMAPTGNTIGYNFHKDVLKAWTPENTDSNIPRFVYGDVNAGVTSDRYLTDASYLNFQNAQIGYTVPEHITRKFHVSRLRVYVTCDNIVYWSKRAGFDPRYSFSGTTNSAVNSPVRTLSGGINITF